MREELAQVVMAAVRGQRALVDKSWQPLRAHVTRRQPLGQVSPEREVGKYERARGYLMPRTDGAEQLLGHRDQAGAPLDRLLLEPQRVVRFREAVLVRRPAQALEIVDVVDDRNTTVDDAQRGDRELVREVMAVDDVRPERLHDLTQLGRRPRVELPPAVEELVARSVPLAERPAAVGKAELDVRLGRAKPDRVLEGPDTGLLLDEEDPPHLLTLMRPRPDRPRGIPHQCGLVLIGLAGFPTATVYGSRSLTTTLPAPTTQLSPIFTPGRITTPIPIQTFLPTSTGRSTCQPCSVTGRSGSSMLWLAVWIIVYGPKFAPS